VKRQENWQNDEEFVEKKTGRKWQERKKERTKTAERIADQNSRKLKPKPRTRSGNQVANQSAKENEIKIKTRKKTTHSSLISQTSQCGPGNVIASTQSAAPRCMQPHLSILAIRRTLRFDFGSLRT
jgi:hypothetical protein